MSLPLKDHKKLKSCLPLDSFILTTKRQCISIPPNFKCLRILIPKCHWLYELYNTNYIKNMIVFTSLTVSKRDQLMVGCRGFIDVYNKFL